MKTPLYDVHIALGARTAPFAGWDMPIQYEGIIQEHLHTRSEASIFDTCHMGVFDIQGASAQADVENLVTLNVRDLAVGQCRYGFMLNEDGGVVDDLTVYRRAEDHFFLVVNAGTLTGDADWIASHLSEGSRFTDLSSQTGKLDIQGPASKEAMEAVLGEALPGLKYFRFTDHELAGIPCTLSRTGYTGEWGYELYFPIGETERVWNLFTAPGRIKPAGLGARDTLRLEVGYPLYGHELNAKQTPVATSRGMFIDMEKDFIGKPAVAAELDKGPAKLLAPLMLDTRRAAREGDPVFSGDAEIGQVVSGSFGPSVGTAIATAFVDPSCAEEGTDLEIEVRGKRLPCNVVGLPFYKDGTARKKKK